ncbi:MAG: septal ring lytic transglycosylase RlpA family protein, partial [Candidatus Omnitrophota bacterium]
AIVVRTDAGVFHVEGVASWYAQFSPGIRRTTANLEIFDHDKMTCAIWDLPFNTVLEVTNLNNGKKVLVRVNDRGPAKRLWREGRVIDLTMAAFGEIEDLEKGLTEVRVRIAE